MFFSDHHHAARPLRAVAAFAAFVITCSPAAMRLNSGPLKAMLNSTAKILDLRGEIPRAPEALGEKSITELLADGTVKFTVDPKYPQAIGISNVLHYTSVFGNSPWDILLNGETDNPFFTSDYPAAIEVKEINTPINRIVPLAPDLAVRIKPDIRLSGTDPNLAFSKFSATLHKLKRQELLSINRLIVQCAEDVILYRDDQDWIDGFVAKNRYYRVELVNQTLSHNAGDVLISTHRIRRHSAKRELTIS